MLAIEAVHYRRQVANQWRWEGVGNDEIAILFELAEFPGGEAIVETSGFHSGQLPGAPVVRRTSIAIIPVPDFHSISEPDTADKRFGSCLATGSMRV